MRRYRLSVGSSSDQSALNDIYDEIEKTQERVKELEKKVAAVEASIKSSGQKNP
jgi:cell division septum initiation protein DivIVA